MGLAVFQEYEKLFFVLKKLLSSWCFVIMIQINRKTISWVIGQRWIPGSKLNSLGWSSPSHVLVNFLLYLPLGKKIPCLPPPTDFKVYFNYVCMSVCVHVPGSVSLCVSQVPWEARGFRSPRQPTYRQLWAYWLKCWESNSGSHKLLMPKPYHQLCVLFSWYSQVSHKRSDQQFSACGLWPLQK